ncbi:CD166 antigen homolog A-like isoform X2 [Corythoichthys intestinalis]|uniref:CD166 antigen homolog A-like isoform X2 n=1 Tax=Corythoichthys intestinalis TaxID=161448 RepID=UPI0025A610CE|nr:CD166 antigen homolog A-like isoform X2 [Corythoichthys intestinalis]
MPTRHPVVSLVWGVNCNLSIKTTDGRTSVFSVTVLKNRSTTENIRLTRPLVSGVICSRIQEAPASVEVFDKAQELQIGKFTKLATCVAKDANPAANITWMRNKKPLVDGGKGVSIRASVLVDPVSGLSSTSSTLGYSATKGDTDAQFSCSVQHNLGTHLESSALTFTVISSTENIVLRVLAPEPLLEGDDVTLICVADGNPAPTSFNFYLKGDVVPVKNTDRYTLTAVSRDVTGEYRCSLIDNPAMMASKNITVNYLDINLSPSGEIVKRAGETLELSFQINSSRELNVWWTKDNVKMDKEPSFKKLKYSDSGYYEGEVKMGALTEKASFDLIVEGAPVISHLSEERSEDGQHKVLICEAEGFPKPSFSWSITGTSLDESPFINGKVVQKITIVPTVNLTVSCSVYNEFGADTRDITVSPHQSEDVDKTQLVIRVVVGLFIFTMVIGLAYGICQRNSRQGSRNRAENENGPSFEETNMDTILNPEE